jgi:hypothetical protein
MKRGFDRGLRAQEIVGICVDKVDAKRYFLVKWEGMEEVDPVDIHECNERIPALVIKFYQDRRIGLLPLEELEGAL